MDFTTGEEDGISRKHCEADGLSSAKAKGIYLSKRKSDVAAIHWFPPEGKK